MMDFQAPLNFTFLLLTFYTLCIICDDYLVPSVEVFIKQFNVPEEVAAVTLVAFGSAAPELFLNSVSAMTHTSDLSLSAILGSGMIAFGLIPPLCFLSIHHNEVFLKLRPILRECGFYVLGLTIFLLSMHDGQIGTNEALLIISVYFVYVGLVIFTYLSSASGIDAVASLKKEMISSNLPLNNSGQYFVSVQSGGDIFSKNSINSNSNSLGGMSSSSPRIISDSMDRDVYRRDVEDIRGYDEEEHAQEHSSLLAGGFDLHLASNSAEDVEVAIPSSMHTNVFERTMHYVNNCIASPIQQLLSYILPQLHPRPSSPLVSSSGPHLGDESGPSDAIPIVPPPYGASSSPVRERSPRSPSPSVSQKQTIPTSPAVNKADLVPLWRAVTVLLVSILCIGLLASVIVALSESLVRSMGVDTSTLGATLVALGAEIPDTISSIALARNGYYDGAIAGAIGSQVINISLGVGVPALFVGLTGNGFLTIAHDQSDSLFFLTCLLFIVIASYVAVTIPVVLMYNQRVVPDTTSVNKAGAIIQIVVWCTVYVIFIYNNESSR